MLLFRQSDLQFLSTLSLRRATGGKQSFIRMDRIFLSTLSLRRATGLAGKVEDAINISIHALLAESDHPSLSDIEQHTYFYPRSPCGERPKQPKHQTQTQYFYPRSPCGERRVFNLFANPGSTISIHALLAESDADALTDDVSTGGFLSTLSLRRATRYFTYYIGRFLISIHALLAESDCTMTITICTASNFYPRSPCGERRSNQPVTMHTWKFLSTLSLRRATQRHSPDNTHRQISIHALLAESDEHAYMLVLWVLRFLSTLSLRRATLFPLLCNLLHHNFYPRSPCGERLRGWTLNINGPIFLSTLSLRRATTLRQLQSALHRNFYPRSPCGERRNTRNSAETT